MPNAMVTMCIALQSGSTPVLQNFALNDHLHFLASLANLGLPAYAQCPVAKSTSTLPAITHKNQGTVKSITVAPAKAPIPTATFFCAVSFGPKPEKMTRQASGTAPRTGRTTLPTMGAMEGRRRRSSPPCAMRTEPRRTKAE